MVLIPTPAIRAGESQRENSAQKIFDFHNSQGIKSHRKDSKEKRDCFISKGPPAMPTSTQTGFSTSKWESKYLRCRFRAHRNKVNNTHSL